MPIKILSYTPFLNRMLLEAVRKEVMIDSSSYKKEISSKQLRFIT